MSNNREAVWLLCASEFSINQLFAWLQAHLMSYRFKRMTWPILDPDKQLSLSPLSPPHSGLLFWGHGWDLLNNDLCPWLVRIQPPQDVLLLHLTVILIDQSLHQIQYEALVQVRAAAGVEDKHRHLQVAGH